MVEKDHLILPDVFLLVNDKSFYLLCQGSSLLSSVNSCTQKDLRISTVGPLLLCKSLGLTLLHPTDKFRGETLKIPSDQMDKELIIGGEIQQDIPNTSLCGVLCWQG